MLAHSVHPNPVDLPFSASQSLEFIDNQLSEIDGELKLLEGRRAHLLHQQTMARRARNAIAPINQLPAELLSEILQLSALPRSYFDHFGRSCIVWELPVLSTCHFWREMVLDLSAMWAQIYISDATPLAKIKA
ncbi:hypothetical protein DL93DRAFT_108978 [Clavulina sp. PMI_390]|nr:hypothetical protein DL93DRAFT_108978 [Clavulina sp. PMI_390]